MDNQINKLNQQIEHLERKKKVYEHSLSQESRKERTRRLIQIGALSEKYFELNQNDLQEVEEIFKQFSAYVKSNKLDKHKKEGSN
ncbi:hypothetical protein GZ22_18475 (plasmid) [Terribacillus saccharophilus]|uniref:Uncharacterized protein n=1 Tax=Terribacillus saccharophilus TaxID=361277 RepID=A0A075LVB7_9BACI|nr:hypothetical protein [Terribacillus goriensis]AIF68413.1 hypothetical protein GZ22_18475 [Terribacillus goriensis]